MATGYITAVDLLTATYQVVLVAPTSYTDIVTVRLTNRNAATTKLRLALTENTLTPSDAEFIEYEYPLTSAGTITNVLDEGGIVIANGQKIVAFSSLASVSVVVYGYEE